MDANTVGAVATLTGVSVRTLLDDAGVDVVAICGASTRC